MKIAVTGATGFIGRPLVRELRNGGRQVVVLTTNEARARQKLGSDVEVVTWKPGQAGSNLAAALRGVDGLVNLAGESIAQRWTASSKSRILESRVGGTRSLVNAMAEMEKRDRPKVPVSSSGIGYYGFVYEPVDESAPPGDDFLARTCVAWEGEARKAEALGTRVVLLRTAVVLGRNGGALQKMIVPFKLYAGGPVGSGRQPFPWIHLDDLVGLIVWALENSSVSGPLNAVAPEAVTNREFSARLGKAIGRPSWLPVPAFALKLVLAEAAEMLLEGQNARPS